MMAEKPILFNTPMVQVILGGRKTQARRVVKPQPPELEAVDLKPLIQSETIQYKPGDVLWVRETFCEVPYEYEHIPIEGGHITIPKYAYKADSEVDYTGIWKPSIHMPREAARLFLRVISVRVERLQDISEEDARAEGCVDTRGFIWSPDNEYNNPHSATDDFKVLWDSLNVKRGYGWDTNPWVWVITFKRVEDGYR